MFGLDPRSGIVPPGRLEHHRVVDHLQLTMGKHTPARLRLDVEAVHFQADHGVAASSRELSPNQASKEDRAVPVREVHRHDVRPSIIDVADPADTFTFEPGETLFVIEHENLVTRGILGETCGEQRLGVLIDWCNQYREPFPRCTFDEFASHSIGGDNDGSGMTTSGDENEWVETMGSETVDPYIDPHLSKAPYCGGQIVSADIARAHNDSDPQIECLGPDGRHCKSIQSLNPARDLHDERTRLQAMTDPSTGDECWL